MRRTSGGWVGVPRSRPAYTEAQSRHGASPMIAETVVDTTALLSDLLASLGLKEPPPGEVTITGHDPIWGTKYPIGEAAAVLLAAIGVAVNDLWELRTGRRQQIH